MVDMPEVIEEVNPIHSYRKGRIMKYDLSIALRICPAFSKTAVGFKDKIDLVAVSCRSLRRALDGIRWKIATILDDMV